MDLRQLFQILRAHMLLVMSCVLITTSLAIGLSLLMQPTYTATTSVVIDFESKDALNPNNPNAQVPLSPGYVATQIDIAASHSAALKVVKSLKLDQVPAFRERFQSVHGGDGSLPDWIADEIRRDLSIKPVRDSRVVNINYVAPDPQMAALLADSFAQSFIDTRHELNTEPARRNSTWLEEQLKGLRTQLEEAQSRLTAFQQKNQILSGEDKVDTEMQRLTDLSLQLSQAQSQVYDVQARQLGENHPAYQRAVAREQSMQQSVAAQKAKVLKLKRLRDEISVLAREADSAQKTYDAAMQRFNQTSLEGQAGQTTVSILNRAVVPLNPSSPKTGMNVVVGILLGVVIGMGAALVREISNRRVRTELDLTQGLGLPLFGVLEKAGA